MPLHYDVDFLYLLKFGILKPVPVFKFSLKDRLPKLQNILLKPVFGIFGYIDGIWTAEGKPGLFRPLVIDGFFLPKMIQFLSFYLIFNRFSVYLLDLPVLFKP